MAPQSSEYEQIAGCWFSLFWRDRLFMAKNHVMHVSRNRVSFTESYKRFYFEDIQAITLRPTATITAVNIFALLGVGLFGLGFLMSEGTQATVFAIITALILAWLIGSLRLGPSCACQIQTAVQVERLTALFRRKQSLIAIEKIARQASLAQGEFNAEHLSTYAREMTSPQVAQNTTPQASPSTPSTAIGAR